MKMRFIKSVLTTAAFSFLIGCAAMTYSERNVDQGNYAAALYGLTYTNTQKREEEAAKTAQKIKEKAGANFQSILAEQTASHIKHEQKSDTFYKNMHLYMRYSEKYGLLNSEQIAIATNQLQRELAASAVNDPSILDQENKSLFPDLPKFMAEAYDDEFQNALNNNLPNLKRYIQAYTNAKNAKREAQLLPVLKARVAELSSKAAENSDALTEMLAAHAATNDADIAVNVKRYITNAGLSKEQLKGEVAEAFPEIAKKELAKREVLIKIVTDSNDPFIDELPEALAAIDEWITVDEGATRKLNIARLRFSERESGPVIRTLTVQNLDFLTLLFIPKNASVLYDSVTTSYDISWSMSVSDSVGKGSKVISGKNGAQRIECSNIRFRNVFGGEGALNNMPSDIQGYCSSSNSVDFQAMRKDVVMRIAQEIVGVIRAGGKEVLKKKDRSV